MQPATIALIIMAITFICFIFEIFPLADTAVGASLAMAVFGIIDYKTAFAGFGNDIVLLCVGVTIIGNALFETGVADLIGRFLSRNFARTEKIFLLSIIVIPGIISMFLSNIATVAMFMPIVASVAASSKGRITEKKILMPLAVSSGMGGLCTLVGSPPQMIAQAMLINGGYKPFGFFDLAVIGIPLLILLMIYFVTVGHKLSDKVLNYDECREYDNLKDQMHIAINVKQKTKQIISIIILLACIAAFIFQIWTVGMIAMLGGILCIITGCISEKKAFLKMDWSTVFILSGALGFAGGLESSGAGKMIADGILNFIGRNASPFVIFAVLAGIATLLTNAISNVATTAMLVPVGISIANALGLNVTSITMGIVIGSSLSFATPTAAPPMTMIVGPGGYRFMDYVKIGGLFTVICYLATIILLPVLMPL